MHVVFFNVLGAGHINPTLPLVEALTGRGDRVTYFCYPPRRDAIENAGAEYRNYGDDDFSVARFHPEGMFPTQLWPAAAGLMPYVMDQLNQLAPDLVVFDSFAPWGYAGATAAGIPAIGSVTTFVPPQDMLDVMLVGPGGRKGGIDDVNRKAFDTLRTQWNVSVEEADFPMRFGETNLVYTAASLNPPLDYRSERFEFIGPMMGRSGNGEKDGLLEGIDQDPRKQLYLSMGTILGKAMGLGQSFYQPFFDALGGNSEYRVFMSTGGVDPAELKAPDNFVVRRSVPQLALLPHVDAFITHAGMNSTMEGLYFGVPLVAVPCFGDQLLNALVIAEHGAGVSLEIQSLNPATIAEAVSTVLTDARYREGAARASQALRQGDGVSRALSLIDRTARVEPSP